VSNRPACPGFRFRPDDLDRVGHYERPVSKVEGLVRGIPGGSSSLPGRTTTTTQVVELLQLERRAARIGESISPELTKRWEEPGLNRAIPLSRGARPVRAENLATLRPGVFTGAARFQEDDSVVRVERARPTE
jgi:hypothetical protein